MNSELLETLKGVFHDFDEWHLKVKSEDLFPKVKRWADSNHKIKLYSNTITSENKTQLKNLIDDFKKSNISKIEELNKVPCYNYAKNFIQSAKELYEEIYGKNFAPSNWKMYFLNVGDSKPKHLRLGCCLLKVYSPNKIDLITPDPDDKNYEGKYKILRKDKYSVYFFDLKTFSEKKRLHLKIRLCSGDDKIILGSYSTYYDDDDKIVTGSIVLEKISDLTLENEENIPKFLSAIDGRKDFEKVKWQIRNFLSLKKLNYSKVPQKAVINLKGLEEFVNSLPKGDSASVEKRFLELKKPIIYISTPQTSMEDYYSDLQNGKKMTVDERQELERKHSLIKKKKNVVLNIVKKLKYEYEEKADKFKVIFENTDIEEMKPIESIKYLEKTRYFILIMPPTSKISFSIIQLAYSITLAKNIFFAYEGNIISERIKSLKELNNNFERKKINSIIKEEDQLYKAIVKFINDNQFDKAKKIKMK